MSKEIATKATTTPKHIGIFQGQLVFSQHFSPLLMLFQHPPIVQFTQKDPIEYVNHFINNFGTLPLYSDHFCGLKMIVCPLQCTVLVHHGAYVPSV